MTYERTERVEDDMAYHLMTLDVVGKEISDHPMHRKAPAILDVATAMIAAKHGRIIAHTGIAGFFYCY